MYIYQYTSRVIFIKGGRNYLSFTELIQPTQRKVIQTCVLFGRLGVFEIKRKLLSAFWELPL